MRLPHLLVPCLLCLACSDLTVQSAPPQAEEPGGGMARLPTASDPQAQGSDELEVELSRPAPAPTPPRVAARVPVDVNAYPELSREALGHLRWILDRANQPLDDFGRFGARNQDDLTAYRYSISFGSYFLASVQYHQLPAWSEAIQPAFDRSIAKLGQRRVWEYWSRTSRGVRTLEPDLGLPYPEAHDPVAEKNIMFSGHVGHLVNLYEMLYRDFHWDVPGSIVYEWSRAEQYVYDNHSLVQVMHRQMKQNAYRSICCEPNAVFPECNQHPALAFVLYDQTHGTQLAKVNDEFFRFFREKGLIDPISRETSMLYLVKQNATLSQRTPWYYNATDLVVGPAVRSGLATLESATADGWTGLFMHAWQPRYIEEQYPYWVRRQVIDRGNGLAELRKESWEPLHSYGFFAALAAELGDGPTRDKLLAYADRRYQPVWEGDTFHYPYDLRRGATDLTDRTLALARVLPKDGLRTLHSRPFPASHFAAPRVEGLDYPRVALSRAVYDAARSALVLSVSPGTQTSGTTRFKVSRLDPARTWHLWVDGVDLGPLAGPSATVAVEVSRPHDVVVLAQ